MKDTRLYFIKDPFVFVPLFLFFGGLTAIYHREQSKPPQVKKEAVTIVKPSVKNTDTTEWRKSYYNHLYNSK